MGSVLGFVGYVPGPGAIGKLGISSIARAMGLRGTARSLQQASQLAGGRTLMRGMSVPMQVGRILGDQVDAYRAANTFFKNRGYTNRIANRLADMADEAVMFGGAGAAASWPQGLDAMLTGGALGAVEGAGMRGIVNFMELSPLLQSADDAVAEGARAGVRALSSSLFTGVPSTVLGAPLEMQVYQYLLGAYFGGLEPRFEDQQAYRYMRGLSQEMAGGTEGRPGGEVPIQRVLNIPQRDDFRAQEPAVQDAILNQARLRWGRDVSEFARQNPDLAPALGQDDRILNVQINMAQAMWDAFRAVDPRYEELEQEALDQGLSGPDAEKYVKDHWWELFDTEMEQRQEAAAPEESSVTVSVPADVPPEQQVADQLQPFNPGPAERLLDELRLSAMKRSLENHEGFNYLARPLEDVARTVVEAHPNTVVPENTGGWTWVDQNERTLTPRRLVKRPSRPIVSGG